MAKAFRFAKESDRAAVEPKVAPVTRRLRSASLLAKASALYWEALTGKEREEYRKFYGPEIPKVNPARVRSPYAVCTAAGVKPHTAKMRRCVRKVAARNPVESPTALAGKSSETAAQRFAVRELGAVARRGVPGVAQEIARGSRREHRQATEFDREIVREIRGRGGIRRPEGVTAEEWRTRIPRALHARKGGGIPIDEWAQELADRGAIQDAYSDTFLDFAARAYEAATSPAPTSDPREAVRGARRVVGEKVRRAARELVRSARRQAELTRCPALGAVARNPVSPAEKIMKDFHGGIRSSVRIRLPRLRKTAYEVGKLEAVIYRPPAGSAVGPEPRIHHFSRPQPRLVGFTGRPPWLIVGGRARFTDRGFEG